MRNRLQRLVVAACAVAITATACSDDSEDKASDVDEVKIGVLDPTTGPSAVGGNDALNGARLAAEIINGKHEDIDLPLAAEEGLPNLGGAKITLEEADSEGDPEIGATAAERLVTDKKVVALTGAYNSGVTKTASERAERLGIPFVNGDSSSTGLTERGLKWFFRTGPSDQMFGETFFSLLAEQNPKVTKIGILFRGDEFGKSGADVTEKLAKDNGFAVAAKITYAADAQDLSAQVQQMRSAKPDVVFLLSLLNDTKLIAKAFDTLNYVPPAVMGYGGGVSDPAFVEGPTDKRLAEGIIRRSAWSPELAGNNDTSKAVATMFQQKYNLPMTENSARSFTAVMTLAMAIDQAGSTEPDKVRAALRNIDIPGNQLIVPWDGVKFDDNQQNAGARGVLEQFQDDKWRVVYPDDVHTSNLVWPMSGAREGSG